MVVKPIVGGPFTITVKASDTIRLVKKIIQAANHVPPEKQKLYLNTTELEDDKTLSDHNVRNGYTLRLEFPWQNMQ